MSKALLLAVKPALPQNHVVDFTVELARQHHLSVDACSVIDVNRLAPPESIPIGGTAFKAERDEHVMAVARQNAAELSSQVEATARAHKVECRTEVVEGDTAAVLTQAAQKCDLLVCGHTPGGDASERSLLHSILKHSCRPALIVPQTTTRATGSVLVAYDGSAQAARALASFVYSGLYAGRPMHIVGFDDGSGRFVQSASHAEVFLSRHGISSDTHITKAPKDVAAEIAGAAKRLSAGLIVMGAFGQSAVHEFFLGSVTHSMLNALPMPVFLDH